MLNIWYRVDDPFHENKREFYEISAVQCLIPGNSGIPGIGGAPALATC